MTTKVRAAAGALLTLTVLSGVGILVHGTDPEPRQARQSVTSPTLGDAYNAAFDELKTTSTGEEK